MPMSTERQSLQSVQAAHAHDESGGDSHTDQGEVGRKNDSGHDRNSTERDSGDSTWSERCMISINPTSDHPASPAVMLSKVRPAPATSATLDNINVQIHELTAAVRDAAEISATTPSHRLVICQAHPPGGGHGWEQAAKEANITSVQHPPMECLSDCDRPSQADLPPTQGRPWGC